MEKMKLLFICTQLVNYLEYYLMKKMSKSKKLFLNYIISLLLLFSIIVTAILGLIQSKFELHRFVPHKYAAYITLFLTFIHLCFNFKKLWFFFFKRTKKIPLR